MRSDLKNLDSFTLETPKNHLIRSFLRNGRLRVNEAVQILTLNYYSNVLIQFGLSESLAKIVFRIIVSFCHNFVP